MKSKILGFMAVGLLCGIGASAANAALISGTWNFTILGGYSGSFTFVNLDTNATYYDSTAAGFNASTSFDTSGSGGAGFMYPLFVSPDYLAIGGLNNGVITALGGTNDWFIGISDFSTNPTVSDFYYSAADYRTDVGSLTRVPEPGTLALLSCGLLGLGFTARRRLH